MEYPYNDEYMIFDSDTNRYILTEKCVMDRIGLQLQEKVNERNAINQRAAINRILWQVSNAIYSYIHKFNYRTDIQDYIIAKVPSARKIIQSAMEEQLLYMSLKGDLSRSTDKEKRDMYIDETAKSMCEMRLPEIGIPIIYTGELGGILQCRF